MYRALTPEKAKSVAILNECRCSPTRLYLVSTTASFMEARFASKKGKTFTISFHKTCGKDLNWEYFGRLCCL